MHFIESTINLGIVLFEIFEKSTSDFNRHSLQLLIFSLAIAVVVVLDLNCRL